MLDKNDRLSKTKKQYEAMQARQKRFQDARENLEKPGVMLKMCIVLGIGLIIGLGFMDPIFKMLGLVDR